MRGVVMSVKGRYAVLLTRDGDFVKIKNKNYSVGDKISVQQNAGRVLAAAASFLVICGGIGSYFTPAGYVSVDINPSLLMTVNIYDRVIDVKALNDDAQNLLESVSVKGKSAEDSLDALIQTSREIGYINESNNDVIVEVVSGINNITLKSGVYSGAEVVVQSADKSDLKTAKSIGVSIAKANAIEEYTRLNGGSVEENAEKLSDMSVKEILSSLAAADEQSSAQAEESADKVNETPAAQTKTSVSEKETRAQENAAKYNYIIPVTGGMNDMNEITAEVVESVGEEIAERTYTEEEAEVPVTYEDYFENDLFDDNIYIPQTFDEPSIIQSDNNGAAEDISDIDKDDINAEERIDTDIEEIEDGAEEKSEAEEPSIGTSDENKVSSGHTSSGGADADAESDTDNTSEVNNGTDNNFDRNDTADSVENNTDITDGNEESDIPSGDNSLETDNSLPSSDSAAKDGSVSNGNESGSDSNVNENTGTAPQDSGASLQDSAASPAEDSAPHSGGAEGESQNSSDGINIGGVSIESGSEPSAGNAGGFDAPQSDGAPRGDEN
ncbi:MAG: anti-sigma factor domain-containing protein [Firmicutes bacterium]|nr:anti-sigma factor domain-containing protein [Bacillota bacterium]